MNINEKIKELEKNLEDIKKELAETQKSEPDKPKRYRAKMNEIFFYLDSANQIYRITENSCLYANYYFNSGNYFHTEEEAKAKQELNQIEMELIKLIEEINDGWTPDWGNLRQKKYYIFYDSDTEKIKTSYSCGYKYQPSKFYCKRYFKIKEINRIGEERLMKYLREV